MREPRKILIPSPYPRVLPHLPLPSSLQSKRRSWECERGNKEESQSGSELPHPGNTEPDHMKDPGGDSLGEDPESHTAQGGPRLSRQ